MFGLRCSVFSGLLVAGVCRWFVDLALGFTLMLPALNFVGCCACCVCVWDLLTEALPLQ